MAYRRKAKTYCLVWTDGDYAGLEVRVKSLPIGKFLDLLPHLEAVQGQMEISVEVAGKFSAAIQGMAEALISWNIEDEDDDGNTTPVPATVEGLITLDPGEMTAIMKAWVEAGAATPAPLGKPSPNGDVEASLPMAELPSSPGN
jgi:hypothetical protein